MDGDTDIQLLIVKQLQRERLVEAEARRLARDAARPPVRDATRRAANGWPRRVLALFVSLR